MRLRIVLDTSSLVRAALDARSAPGRLLDAAARGRVALVGSPDTLGEAAEVLGRAKLRTRLSDARRSDVLAFLFASTFSVEPTERVAECRDPGDDIILEAALAGGADLIVSDDRDLLALDPWRGVRIVKPEAALALLATEP